MLHIKPHHLQLHRLKKKVKKKCWEKCCANVIHFIVPPCRAKGFVLLLQRPLPPQSPLTVLPFTIHLVLSSIFLHFFVYYTHSTSLSKNNFWFWFWATNCARPYSPPNFWFWARQAPQGHHQGFTLFIKNESLAFGFRRFKLCHSWFSVSWRPYFRWWVHVRSFDKS